MNPRAAFAPPDELPIPEDAGVGKGWTGQMIEMADHIGAYATLQVVAAFGGEYFYVPVDPAQNRLAEVIGPDKAAIVSHVYARERLRIPVGRAALAHARRQPVLAAVRAGALTIADAARMLGSTQPFVSHLVNQTGEGTGTPVPPRLRRHRRAADPRQLDLLGDDPAAPSARG